MKVPVKIYLVKDSHGNEASATCEEGADTVQICGMKDKDGNPQYFESEAYHIHSFCNDYGFELRIHELSYEFDDLWEEAK